MSRQTLFWLIMLLFTMLIPLFMIFFGAVFKNSEPKKINEAFGYRTRRSMKNLDTWIFAHHYIGRLWLRIGLIVLIPTVIAGMFAFGKDADTIGMRAVITEGLQLIPMVISIIMTERALKKTFDKDGKRLSEE